MEELTTQLGEVIAEMREGRWDSALSLRFMDLTKQLAPLGGLPVQELRERCYALADQDRAR